MKNTSTEQKITYLRPRTRCVGKLTKDSTDIDILLRLIDIFGLRKKEKSHGK